MEYYREIDIKSWQDIQQFCLDKWNNLDKSLPSMVFSKDDLEYLGQLIEPAVKDELGVDVSIKSAIMFISAPKFVQDMHVDGFTIERINASNSALNLPILNCNEGPMYWYSGEYYLTKSKMNNLKYLQINWTTEPSLACRKVITKPTLVKINVPHHIENLSDSPRLMLSIRFNPDIQLG
jgi:hypothetical protein